jgi:hypothetical protein
VVDAVKDWREPAIRLGISKKEMDMFGVIFTNKTINRNRQ